MLKKIFIIIGYILIFSYFLYTCFYMYILNNLEIEFKFKEDDITIIDDGNNIKHNIEKNN